MKIPYRWAWLALAALTVVALLWTQRYQYEACDTDGCVAINRWSGVVTFREAAELDYHGPGGAVVRNSTRRAPTLLREARVEPRRRAAAAR